jgi:hypothetical protein
MAKLRQRRLVDATQPIKTFRGTEINCGIHPGAFDVVHFYSVGLLCFVQLPPSIQPSDTRSTTKPEATGNSPTSFELEDMGANNTITSLAKGLCLDFACQ